MEKGKPFKLFVPPRLSGGQVSAVKPQTSARAAEPCQVTEAQPQSCPGRSRAHAKPGEHKHAICAEINESWRDAREQFRI